MPISRIVPFGLAITLAGPLGATQDNAEPAAAEAPQVLMVVEPEGPGVTRDGDAYVSGRCRTGSPLPEGYPAPTAPGAIELKLYPTVRRAEVDMTDGQRSAFWPLFGHIKDRDIAMTAPVEMTLGEEPGDGGSMAFLYRNSDLGPTGEVENDVSVVDAEPVLVLSLGVKGPNRDDAVRTHLETLGRWLDDHPDYTPTRLRRVMGYNGPSTRPADRWWEVQVGVRRVETGG